MSPKIKLNFTPFQHRICVVSYMYFLWEFRCSPVGKGIMLLFQQNNSEQYSDTTDSQLQHIGRHITPYSVYMYTILGRYLTRLSVDISAESVNQQRSLLYTWSKSHEPVGRVQFGVLEKFTSAYLFQTTQEKSCDYLLKICMKKFWRWLSRRNTHISCNQGENCAIQGTHLI